MELYCFSRDVLERPSCGNHPFLCDFGPGFYCADSLKIAIELAPLGETHGYCCHYKLDTTGLNVMNLNGHGCTTLNWVAILVRSRRFDLKLPVAQAAADYLLQNFLPDIGGVDIIRGYRADGVYFSFARDFLNNAITFRQLEVALEGGELGEELVLKSKRAVSRLRLMEAIPVTALDFYDRCRREREGSAKKIYLGLEGAGREDLFIADIMKRGGGQWLQTHIQKFS